MKNSTNRVSTAIYVRVSTEDQAQEGFSIRAQVDKLKAYSHIKGWEIYDIYSDEGISGKNIVDRPAINKLIDDVNDGKVNNVLVFKIDRLTRNTKNLLELVELFEENNCAFNSLTESVDTDTPSGRMFLKIIGIFAEFERENLVSRLKLGFERKVKEGYTLANYSISYGYSKEAGQKVQTIQPDEAKIVRDIFSMYVEKNYSLSGIARTLNKRKIPTKRNGKTWDTTTIKGLLMNPTYIGKVRYAITDEDNYFETNGHHEAILSNEIFELAQEKIKNIPKYAKTKRPKEENYFCGVLVCSLCGGKYTTHNYTVKSHENPNKIKNSSYRCGNKKYYNKDISCQSSGITHVKLESAFCDYIKNIDNFEPNDHYLENDSDKREQELLEYITDCEKKLSVLTEKKNKLMEQLVNDEIAFEDYKAILSIMNEKFNRLGGELARSKTEVSSCKEAPTVSRQDIILNLKENWDYLTDNERMMFLQRFVKRIVVSIDKAPKIGCVATIEKLDFNDVRKLDDCQRLSIKKVWECMGKER